MMTMTSTTDREQQRAPIFLMRIIIYIRWIRIPILVFLSLVVVEYCLESYYSEWNRSQIQPAPEHKQDNTVVASSLTTTNILKDQSTNQQGHEEEKEKMMTKGINTKDSSSTQKKQKSPPPPPLWTTMGYKTCRFPEFYDPTRRPYNLNDKENNNNQWIPNDWIVRRRNELKTMSYANQPIAPPTESYLQQQMKLNRLRQQQQSRTHDDANVTVTNTSQRNKNLTFVHIGKSSGSSVGCHIAESRRYVRKHCNSTTVMKFPVPLTSISLRTNCYTHWSGHMYCYDDDDRGYYNNNDYLVTIRNPISRISSWFLYEHIENHLINYSDRDYHCGDWMLYNCYSTFDELVSIGLMNHHHHHHDSSSSSSSSSEYRQQQEQQLGLRIGANLTAEECSNWAWAAVQGNIPAAYHNFYNYDWYAHHMFKSSSPLSSTSKDSNNKDEHHTSSQKKKEIYVIRSEHFEQDWRTIDGMLQVTGSSGSSSSSFPFPSTLLSPQNSAQQKKLPVSNKTTSSLGIQNLCRALCEEIQIYKKLLKAAVNLNSSDVEISLEELQGVCPEEGSLEARQHCHHQQQQRNHKI